MVTITLLEYHAAFWLTNSLLAFGIVSGEISLNSTINGILQGGEEVNFTCTTVGSLSLSWLSDEYIGNHLTTQVNLARENQTTSPNNYTTAVLSQVSGEGVNRMLVSILTIILQPQFASSTITCLNIGTGESKNTTFCLSETPQVSGDNQVACPGDSRTFTCETHGSKYLVWISSIDGSRIMFSSYGNNTVNQSTNGVARRTENEVVNGITVLKSVLNITVTSNIEKDRRQYITCLNHDLNREGIVAIQMSDNCISSTSASEETQTTRLSSIQVSDSEEVLVPAQCSADSVTYISIIVVMGCIVILSLVVISVLSLLYKLKRHTRSAPAKNKEIPQECNRVAVNLEQY